MTPAQLYAAKLKRPEWFAFRAGYMDRLRDECGEDSVCCFACGSSDQLQLHHRRYVAGREPWDYPDEDLVLVCDPCHDRVHAVAKGFHDWIISIDPHWAWEARYLLDELRRVKDPGVALARCKNAVRDCFYSDEWSPPGLLNGADILARVMADLGPLRGDN